MELIDRIQKYWSTRSDEFYKLRIDEFESDKRNRWIEIISCNIPKDKCLNILDIGTGTGFFAVLMASLGHNVIGIDLCEDMINNAKTMSDSIGYNIDFRVMNAQKLDFEDNTFDVLLSRNLTWTLQDVESTYKEWYRVLKDNAILLNFDADYGETSFTEQLDKLSHDHAHSSIDKELIKECDYIKNKLEISNKKRPNWDVDILKHIGFRECSVDYEVNNKIYKEHDRFYNPNEMFGLYVRK